MVFGPNIMLGVSGSDRLVNDRDTSNPTMNGGSGRDSAVLTGATNVRSCESQG